ncbi:substrate-binding domain-containing protein [Aureimonas psammosilenae]|uniref:substrate-binding domain-containing protein n=1 Tax=Aureimonas psammosilenae TaxID=2495496 RepID=UPI001261382C|nr:substrate-binding domain-containing protein [Aureimonas psammosilenae]
MLKRLPLFLASMLLSAATPASAATLGVAMAQMDDTFRSLIAAGIRDHAGKLEGVTLRVEDAKGDVDRQIQTMKDLVAAKVDAIVVNPVDGDTGPILSKIAADAGIPLVYVNSEPVNVDELPTTQSFVASDENDSGTLETQEVCRRLGGKGDVVVMVGETLHYAARRRTDKVREVLAGPDCKDIRIVEMQSAVWSKPFGEKLMREWLAAGVKFDGVIANNDDMALGAIQAMNASGLPMNKIVVGGIDATAPALAAMAAGDLDVTVFQNAKAQGAKAVDAALALARGESVPRVNYVPFELVTSTNMAEYLGRN